MGEADIKGPEWDVLTEANPPPDYPHFMSKTVGTPSAFAQHISRVLLLVSSGSKLTQTAIEN